MAYSVSRKNVLVLAIVVALVIVAVAVFGSSSDKDTGSNTKSGKSTPTTVPSSVPSNPPNNPKVGEQGNIGVADFTYTKPNDWATLAQDALAPSLAVSGMSRTAAPAATFTVRVSGDTPKSASDQKDSTLAELKKLTQFQLTSSGDTKVDGKTGQRFTYTFTDSNSAKLKQEMTVVVNKNKTYFLLFSAPDVDFDKQRSDFDKILSSFKFK